MKTITECVTIDFLTIAVVCKSVMSDRGFKQSFVSGQFSKNVHSYAMWRVLLCKISNGVKAYSYSSFIVF